MKVRMILALILFSIVPVTAITHDRIVVPVPFSTVAIPVQSHVTRGLSGLELNPKTSNNQAIFHQLGWDQVAATYGRNLSAQTTLCSINGTDLNNPNLKTIRVGSQQQDLFNNGTFYHSVGGNVDPGLGMLDTAYQVTNVFLSSSNGVPAATGADIANAMILCFNKNLHTNPIINAIFWDGGSSVQPEIASAMQSIGAQGAPIFVPAIPDSTAPDPWEKYRPFAPTLVVVGACNPDGSRASFSGKADLLIPIDQLIGYGLDQQLFTDKEDTGSITFVASAIFAKLWDLHPNWTMQEVLIQLQSTSKCGCNCVDIPAAFGINTPTHRAPIVGINGPASLQVGQSGIFSANVQTFDGASVTAFRWTFSGPEGNIDDTGQQVSHTFNVAGQYLVQVTVTDSFGMTTTTNMSVNVTQGGSGSPIADIKILHLGLWPDNTVEFDCSNSIGSNGSGIARYELRPGEQDNDIESGSPEIAYSYARPGTFTATLDVTDNNGRKSEKPGSVTFQLKDSVEIIKRLWVPDVPGDVTGMGTLIVTGSSSARDVGANLDAIYGNNKWPMRFKRGGFFKKVAHSQPLLASVTLQSNFQGSATMDVQIGSQADLALSMIEDMFHPDVDQDR